VLLENHISHEPAHAIEDLIWLGSKQAAYPGFASKEGFTAILSISSKKYDESLNWLKTDPYVTHCEVIVGNQVGGHRRGYSRMVNGLL